MKKLTIIIFVLLAFKVQAQQKIQGLGYFKVCKSNISIIDSISSEINRQIGEISTNEELYSLRLIKTPNIYKVIYDTTSEDPIQKATMNPKGDVYCLINYSIADITIDQMFLSFYNDTLISINIDEASIELTDAIKNKYGKGVVKITEKPVNCTFTYTGNKVTYKDITILCTWRNDNIISQQILSTYYDSGCKENAMNLFFVTAKTYNKLDDYDKIFESKLNTRKQAEAKAKLKNF